jgi:hypothetical protein
MDFDIDLMGETSLEIFSIVEGQISQLNKTHGSDFAWSVQGNVGCFLLASLLASEEDDGARLLMLLDLIKSLSLNVTHEVAGLKADELIEQIKKGSKC